mgnify:CR=1 FL=1
MRTGNSSRQGGLISFGASYADMHRAPPTMWTEILKGTKPGDLPSRAARTRFELVINLKTAKALGLTDPAVGAGARGSR